MRLSQRAWRSLPSTLFARMTLILLAGLLGAQATSLWLQWGERANVVAQARGLNFTDRFVDAIRVLEAAAPQSAAAVAALQARGVLVTVLADDEVAANLPRGQLPANIAARLGSARDIRVVGGGGMPMQHGAMGRMGQNGKLARSFDVHLSDGRWVRITAAPDNETPPALPADLIVQLLLTLAIVIAVVVVAVRQVTQPLRQLAEAADQLGRDLDAPPLAERGPLETRHAAQAFNRMQARIKHLVAERARALAAVSHDLRTPLTRLRLRAELVDDEALREQMAGDLEAMAAMLDATLDYLRGLQENEAPRLIDVDALVHSLADDNAVVGRAIAVSGSMRAPYAGRLSALRRALQNLIDNAIKYGGTARLHIDDSADALRLVVEDDGPGIPDAELARVGTPYYRPDVTRSRETGGVGLGLSIVKDIAHLHGGELQLSNRPAGGFCAMLLLPRAGNEVRDPAPATPTPAS